MQNDEKAKGPSIGGLVGEMRGGTIVDCHASGTIKVNGHNVAAGGLVGRSDGGTITNCTSDVQIEVIDSRFDELRATIESNLSDKELVTKFLNSIAEMQQLQNTPAFVGSYQRFVSMAAAHMAIIGPFLPFLTGLLPSY